MPGIETAPHHGLSDSSEAQRLPVTLLDDYLATVRNNINQRQMRGNEHRKGELNTLQKREQFTVSLRGDLTGTGPRLEFLTDEDRDAYRDFFLEPLAESELGEEDSELVMTTFISKLQNLSESYQQKSP